MKFSIVTCLVTFLLSLALAGAQPIALSSRTAESESGVASRSAHASSAAPIIYGRSDLSYGASEPSDLFSRRFGGLVKGVVKVGKLIVKGFQKLHQKVKAWRARRKANGIRKKAAKAARKAEEERNKHKNGQRK